MFCTKCGKEVFAGDRFCGNCGCEVRTQRATTNDEIVFNPPFREEAKRKTEEMKSTFVGFKTTEKVEEPQRPRRDSVNFDWGMEGNSHRKVDNSVFDWSGVVEQRKRQRGLGLEMRETKPMEPVKVEEEPIPTLPPVQVIGFAQPASTLCFEREEAPMSIEDLEREIFGEAGGIEHKANTKITTKELTELEAEIEELDLDEAPSKPVVVESNFVPAFQQELEETATDDVYEEADEAEASRKIDEAEEVSEKEDVLDETIELHNDKPQFLEEKFYTFNQKCDAFDELIEREKSHLTGMGIELPGQSETKDSVNEIGRKTGISTEKLDFAPEKTIVAGTIGHAINRALDDKDTKDEIEFEKKEPVANDIEDILIQAEEEKKKKLRYSDVFPRVEVDANGNPVKNAENYSPVPDMVVKHDPVVPQIIAKNKQRKEEEKTSEPVVYNKRPEKPKTEVRKDLTGIFDKVEIDEEPPKKRHILSKLIIFILVLMILCEGVILGTKFIAPESDFSAWVSDKVVAGIDFATNLYERVTHKDVRKNDVITEEASGMQLLVLEAASNAKKIGEVIYNPDILFGMISNPAFPEVKEASNFEDEEWFEDKNGNTKTYGQVLMAAIVKYYDGWKDINKDENLLGINSLEIGETKIGNTGFYTLVRVVYATADGDELEMYQTVYTGVSDESIVINMVKEETI